ncbi:caspase family protein [Tahibacter caeni]|uniref:caspase family protein n=1 Tax=Tahibacter caeni TaxID=1453545 RepID=UPI002147AAE9|nr:caspase family protein [Tahibacter caeni]
MVRAAVFIGVDRAAGLAPLHDAAAGARRLHDGWAAEQKFAYTELVTDEGGAKVTLDRVYDAVGRLLRPDVEQLVVYFAGHGVNAARHECWLLSDAPRVGHAVISATISEEQARYCGVPHVVFISDACRTAPASIGLQNVNGNGIFPNEEPSGTEKPVDLFFGASLGRPAFEVSNVDDAAAGFTALYTDALANALRFGVPELVDWTGAGAGETGLIRPRRLRDYLGKAVTRTIRDRNLPEPVVQVPDARITSDPQVWVSRRLGRPPPPPQIQPAPAPPFSMAPPAHRNPDWLDDVESAGPGSAASASAPGEVDASFESMQYDFDVTGEFESPFESLRSPRRGTGAGPAPDLREASGSLVSLALQNPGFVADLLSVTDAAGPRQFETQCGFKLRGARVREAFALGATVQKLGRAEDIVRVGPQQPAPLVLLVLDDGGGVVAPAIRDFIGALTFDGGEFVDLAYEPSANSGRAGAYRDRARELQTLRKVVAAASRNGSFRLEGDDAATLARRMQLLKGVDPSLAIYAAYAYYDRRDLPRLAQMHDFLRDDLGASLFDVALLSGALDGRTIEPGDPLLGLFPLLSQGWIYLRTRRVSLPGGTEILQAHLRDSLWTQFDARGVDRLRSTCFKDASPWQLVD